jgi:hypothetical protein
MFGLLGFPGAARIGEADTRIPLRRTANLAVRKHSVIVVSFGADVQANLTRFIGD